MYNTLLGPAACAAAIKSAAARLRASPAYEDTFAPRASVSTGPSICGLSNITFPLTVLLISAQKLHGTRTQDALQSLHLPPRRPSNSSHSHIDSSTAAAGAETMTVVAPCRSRRSDMQKRNSKAPRRSNIYKHNSNSMPAPKHA